MENTTASFCGNCGKELKEGQRFCAHCGHSVTPPVPSVPPAADAPVETAAEVPVAAVPATPKKKAKVKKEKVKKEKPKKEKKKKKALAGILTGSALVIFLLIASLVVTLVGATVCGVVFFGIPYAKYQAAQDALENGLYDEAYQDFADLGDFMNSEDMANRALYQKAMAALQNGQYDEANRIFLELGDYSDSSYQAQEALYQKASALLKQGQYDEAHTIFLGLGDYSDSAYMANEALYHQACNALANYQYDTAIALFTDLGDFKDSNSCLKQAKYKKADELFANEQYKEAYLLYTELGTYDNSESEALVALMMWEAKALNNNSTTMANDLKKTVNLRSSQYEVFYSTIALFITGHEEASFWFNYGATDRTKNVLIMLEMLPSTYEDVALLKQLFTALNSTNNYSTLFTTYATTIEKCFSLPFVQDLATHNDAISYFLLSDWNTSSYSYHIEFYKNNSDGISATYNLPWPTQPDNVAYYDIDGMIFYWDDINSNHVMKVFRFEIVDYNTIRVYCYKNSQSYYLYRS